MVRETFKRCRTGLLGACTAAVLALSPQPAAAFLDTEKAWNDLLQFAVRQVNAPGEFEIELGPVTRPDDGFAQIESLRIRDGDGVWLEASNLRIDWQPTSLLRGRFVFETLGADEIRILRAPITRGDPPAEEAGIDFAWPRPPVSMAIESLDIRRITLAGGLLPQDIEASVTGSFSDRDDVQNAVLNVRRIDRPGDEIALESNIDFDNLDIAFSLDATEKPGGLVAQMAGLPADQALEITLGAEGNPEALPFDLYADIGQIGIAEGKGTAKWADGIGAAFEGTVKPGEETAPEWRRALGDAARISVDVAETDPGAYRVSQLSIASNAFALDGKGIVDSGANEIDLALEFAAQDVEALNAVIAPARMSALSGKARATGALTAPVLDVDARVANLVAGFGEADALQLRINSAPAPGGAESDSQGVQRFSLDARAIGLDLNDAGLREALGESPSLTGEGAFYGQENRVALDQLKLDAKTVNLEGDASYDIARSALSAAVSGEARRLGPFLRAADLAVDGAAMLALKIDNLTSDSVERLFLNAQLTELKAEDPTIAAALGGAATLEMLLAESAPGRVTIERGFLESEVIALTARGDISVPEDDVDLELDWQIKAPDKLSALIAPASLGGASGTARLDGTLSEPSVSVEADAQGIAYDAYSAGSARIAATGQLRKDRRAPFTLSARLAEVETGDAAFDDLLGSSPEIEADGLYDTATGLLSLDSARVDLDGADVALDGDIHLNKRTLDVGYRLDAEDLTGFSKLAAAPLAGAIDVTGRLEGPFALPLVTAKGAARNLRYAQYSVDALDLDIETTGNEDESAAQPFRIDISASNPATGDADFDSLLGETPSLSARGTLDRTGPAISLDFLDAKLAAARANASGFVDLASQKLDLDFDIASDSLKGLSSVIGKEVRGALTAKGRAAGSFAAPEVRADISGTALRYDSYRVARIAGDIDIRQAATGFAPFEIDVTASGVALGDPALDALLKEPSRVKASGQFDQSRQIVRITSAAASAASADLKLSGDMNLGAQSLDVDFDLKAPRLAPFSGLIGTDLGGAVSAKGSAKGPFNLPAVDVQLDGQNLSYGPYRIASVEGSARTDTRREGRLPFDFDLRAEGVSTGDPELDELLTEASAIKARGSFDPERQVLRLAAADARVAGSDASLSGTIDLERGSLDVDFDIDAPRLAPFGGLAGVDLQGALSARGSARGTFTAPEVDAALSGRNLRYDTYSIAELDGSVSAEQRATGFAPFSIDATARGIGTGDPALDAAIGPEAVLRARGGFNSRNQRLRLDAFDAIIAAANASARGDIDLEGRTLDITFDADAAALDAFSRIAGAPLGGSASAAGRVSGAFSDPALEAAVRGQSLAYGAYRIGRIDGEVSIPSGAGGPAPFRIDATASAISTGDPKLDDLLRGTVSVDARGTLDRAAQRVSLDAAHVDAGFLRASASGSVDLAAQSLDIVFDTAADDLSPLSAIAGNVLGGTLGASGRVSGAFSDPSIDASLNGQSLSYGAYRIGRIDGDVAIPNAASGDAPFRIDATASTISTGDPKLDGLLRGTVTVDASGRLDRTAQSVRLDSARVDAGFAAASAQGRIDLAAQSLDISFDVAAGDLGPFSGLAGKPLGGALSASGTARGPFVIPSVTATARGTGLYFDTYSLGALDLDLSMPNDPSGALPFALTATATSPRLGNPQIESLLGETVRVSANGVFDPQAQTVRLDASSAELAVASAQALGLVDLGAQMLDLEYAADVGNLGALQGFVGKPLAGAANVSGRLSGPFSDPATSGRLSGRDLLFDRYRARSLAVDFDVRTLVSGPAGRVDANGETDLGPLQASASFDLGAGVQRIESFSLEGLGVEANGGITIFPGGTFEGNATLRAFQLATLGQFLGQDISGVADGTVSLSAPGGRQSAVFDLTGSGLRYAQDGQPLATIGAFQLAGRVDDALAADPLIDATLGGSDAVVQGFPVQRLAATARGQLSALDITVAGNGGVTGSEKLDLAARVNLAYPPRSAYVSRLSASYLGIPIAIVQPMVVEEIPPGGFRLRDLDARIDDGELRGGLEYTSGGIVAQLTMRNLPLQLARLAGTDLIRSGRLDGDINVDTRGQVAGRFAVTASLLRLKGAQIDDPFDVTITGNMDGRAANIIAEMRSAMIVEPLRARATIPLIAQAGSPLPLPDRNAPFSAQVDWEGDVAEVWSFVPAPDHVLSGPVVINGRAGGTLNNPTLSGGAALTGGQYSNLEFGTLLTDLNARADFTSDGRVAFDLTGTDGVQGTVAGSGSYVVGDNALDARLDLNNAALVRRDDLTAVISGNATARTRGDELAIDGSFRTDYVELRLIGGFGGSLVVIDVIPVGETAPIYVEADDGNGRGQRIALNVSLDFPNRVFVRGRGLDSEWGGRIDVTGYAADPKINGAIEERRGFLDLLGRQFELTIGEVRFSGSTDPYIRVRLTRKANDITGWLEVEGYASDLDISFGSIPSLPEEEVLPRLLFGRSKQSLTALEAAQLAAGVATLLSGKAGLLDSVRGTLGVDVLRVESGDDGSTSVVTGKYVNEDIFVGAKQNLSTSETSGLVEIEVFDNVEIEAELGSTEAKGSVNWSIDY